jgi:PAS domain S-box-containing protein
MSRPTSQSIHQLWGARAFLVLFLLWSLIAGIVMAMIHSATARGEREVALYRARDSFEKDRIYRRWAAERGGVYVVADSRTPPNPWLIDHPHRDVWTSDGRMLTLVNPAYMTRMVQELGAASYGLKGHITSLRPLRPGNAPDDWERKALGLIEGGAAEYSEIMKADGKTVLRYMGAFYVEQSCLTCHAKQGYRLGDVRGGIGITVPIGPGPTMGLGLTGPGISALAVAIFWVLGGAGIFLWGRRVTQSRSEQAHLIEALEASSHRFDTIQATTPDGLCCLDPAGRIEWVNDTYCRVLGYRQEELIGQPLSLVEAKEAPEETARRIDLIKQGGRVQQFRTRHRTKDGRELDMEIRVAPLGQTGQIISFVRDITQELRLEEERRKLEAEVQHTQKLESLGSLAGGIAHDMNNVLSAIFSMVMVLQLKREKDEDLQKSLRIIENAAGRGRDLVKGLTDFARKGLQQAQAMDLNALVQKELDLLVRTSRQRFLFDVHLAEGLPPIKGDASSLGSAFMNLCVNAFDAMPQGGSLTIRTDREDGWVRLLVGDTGQGIPAAILHRVTDPFFTTKPPGRGTGLGLAMVYGTVKAHGGTLDIQSEVGKGTLITLRFPVLGSETRLEAAKESLAGTMNRPLNILLVDDDELIRSTMPLLLERLGHRVEIASGGLEALRRLDAGLEVDLLILDHNMPGMSGADTLPRIFQLRPTLRVLIATGFQDTELRLLLAEFPAVLAIQKPFSLEQLREALQGIGST